MATGSCTMRWRVINMRDSYMFAFFRNGLLLSSFSLFLYRRLLILLHPWLATANAGGAHGILIQKSNVVTFAHDNEPTQGHLALTGVPSEMK